jgi:hypothetical protein
MNKYWTRQEGSAAFGGYEYRVTTNGETIQVQERSPNSNSFITKLEMSVAEYEEAQRDWHQDDVNFKYIDPGRIAGLLNGY